MGARTNFLRHFNFRTKPNEYGKKQSTEKKKKECLGLGREADTGCCVPVRFGRLGSWLFSFSSTTLRIKRAAIHIGITDAKGSTKSLILLFIQFCQLVSLSYSRGKKGKGLKEIENEGQTHIHKTVGKSQTRLGKDGHQREGGTR